MAERSPTESAAFTSMLCLPVLPLLQSGTWRNTTGDSQPSKETRQTDRAVIDSTHFHVDTSPTQGSAHKEGGHTVRDTTVPKMPVVHLPPRHLYTCTVGRQRSNARFLLNGSGEVAHLLQARIPLSSNDVPNCCCWLT